LTQNVLPPLRPHQLPDPLHDYDVLRRELALYNPEYARRPHVVALNKVDLPAAAAAVPALVEQIGGRRSGASAAAPAAAAAGAAGGGDAEAAPFAVVPVSAATGTGLPDLLAALQSLLRSSK